MFYVSNTSEQNDILFNSKEYKLWLKMANISYFNDKVKYEFVFKEKDRICVK